MNSLHVKRGDTVLVLAGKDKGKIGRILAADPSSHRVQVENVNTIIRHQKPRGAGEQGGRIEAIGFIDSSNVMVVCGACSKPTRIAHKEIDGKKARVCKHCGASLDVNKLDKKGKKKKDDKPKKTEKKVEKAEVKPEKKVEAKVVEKADKKTEKVAAKKTDDKKKVDDKKAEKKKEEKPKK